MTAAASGSDAAMLAAQQAPIGAKICTTNANRTIGRNLFSRARIANPSEAEPNHQGSPKSRSGSRVFIPPAPDYPACAGVRGVAETAYRITVFSEVLPPA